MADHFRLRRFERLLGGYPVEPALLRQFFVVGKIELDQQVDPPVARHLQTQQRPLRPWTSRSRISSFPRPLCSCRERISKRASRPHPPWLFRRRIPAQHRWSLLFPRARTSARSCCPDGRPVSTFRVCAAPAVLLLRSCRNRKSEWIETYIFYSGPQAALSSAERFAAPGSW